MVSINFGANNCHINLIDVANVPVIYGSDSGGRAKTVKREPDVRITVSTLVLARVNKHEMPVMGASSNSL